VSDLHTTTILEAVQGTINYDGTEFPPFSPSYTESNVFIASAFYYNVDVTKQCQAIANSISSEQLIMIIASSRLKSTAAKYVFHTKLTKCIGRLYRLGLHFACLKRCGIKKHRPKEISA
jgi:hypothetical protein